MNCNKTDWKVGSVRIRALIIAVEDYPKSKTTSTKLEGTIANAENFANALQACLNVPPENILFCCSGTTNIQQPRGANKQDVSDAIQELIRVGANQTDCLFVYLSGHGVMKPAQGPEPHTDVLLCADFISNVGGTSSFQIDELTTRLARGLGVGTHLTFVDACRTADPVFPITPFDFIVPQANGTADRLRLSSVSTGNSAVNDGLFTNTLIDSLNGRLSLEIDPTDPTSCWVTFRSILNDVNRAMEPLQRVPEPKTEGKADYRIHKFQRANAVPSVLSPDGRKAPPVELLRDNDEIIFLGETNSQLAGKLRDGNWTIILNKPNFLEQAFELRKGRKWKRLDVFSIEDLSTAGRPDRTVAELELERQEAEDFLRTNASRLAIELRLYRYAYAGVYASLWTSTDEKRRAHVSPRVLGMDIRTAPSSDFVDFPGNRHPTIGNYFELVKKIVSQPSTCCIYKQA